MLSVEQLRGLLDYSMESGNFVWRKRQNNDVFNRVFAGKVAGFVHSRPSARTNYIYIKILGVQYLAHRLAYLYCHGKPPSGEIDHIDGNGLNNRIGNLRDVDRRINSRNKPLQKNNSSGANGVSWSRSRRKWVATISIDGKNKNLGGYDDLSDAIVARRDADIFYGFHRNHGRDT